MCGGLYGYSGGSKIRPWYMPPSKSVPSAPRIVKCLVEYSVWHDDNSERRNC
jgi:hypothetical protein